MYSWRKLLISSYIFIYKRKTHNLFKYKNLKLVEYALIIHKFPNDDHSDNFRSQILVREKNSHHHVIIKEKNWKRKRKSRCRRKKIGLRRMQIKSVNGIDCVITWGDEGACENKRKSVVNLFRDASYSKYYDRTRVYSGYQF